MTMHAATKTGSQSDTLANLDKPNPNQVSSHVWVIKSGTSGRRLPGRAPFGSSCDTALHSARIARFTDQQATRVTALREEEC